jgi:teichuronic acid biosynthesis glycosyltransferase TuaH
MIQNLSTGKGKRILYLMQVDWRWIRQRPHILAEGLTQDNTVLVAHRYYLDRARHPANPSPVVRTGLVPTLDRGGSFWRSSDAIINRWRTSHLIAQFKPDLIWLCFPSLYAYLPKDIDTPLVYDCMDDATGFYPNAGDRAHIAQLETELIDRAALVLCSSQNLLERLKVNHTAARLELLRNGLPQAWLSREVKHQPTNATECHVAYIGTVAAWFDWKVVLMALERLPTLRVHIIGPGEAARPKHERLIRHGPVAHSQLLGLAEQFQAFIMPFQVTPLIEGVDPVKLYEYLAFDREVIAVHYTEIERFAPFMHLYREGPGFVNLLERLVAGRLERRNSLEAYTFLQHNTWEQRIQALQTMLSSIPSQSFT